MSDENKKEELEKFANKRIFFLHQSVGFNIIDGINEIFEEKQMAVNLHTMKEKRNKKKGYFIHDTKGRNKEPITKIRAFEDCIGEFEDGEIDIALMKFCYVDFGKRTKIDEIFDEYKKVVRRISEKMKDVQIVHMTVPLKSREKKIRDFLKKILGREKKEDISNIVRYKFSQRILREFGGQNVFDIAMFESTKPNGERTRFKYNGCTYYSLYEGYTDDGGHLNAKGRKIIAQEFIKHINGVKKI